VTRVRAEPGAVADGAPARRPAPATPSFTNPTETPFAGRPFLGHDPDRGHFAVNHDSGWRRRLSLVLLLTLAPSAALAHASERAVILTLPTGRYILAAAAAVALTALLLPLAPRLPAPRPRRLLAIPVPPAAATSWAGCLLLLALVLLGFLGPRDPLENLLPLTIWTLLWSGLALASMAFGNLWRAIEPWTGPATTLRRLLGLRGGVGLARLGAWPGVAGLLAIAWFQLVSLAPSDPAVLARAALLYWLAILALATLEGPAWIARGEAVTLLFGFIARIAPFWWQPEARRLRLYAGLPGVQIAAMPPLAPGAAAFVALMLATVTFDGLSDTFWWLARIGVNPLDFPGRSAVVGANTLGLLAAWALTAAAILAAIALGHHLAGARGPLWPAAARILPSFLPIAAAYHAAHYLVDLLTGGQYWVAALDDPFERGWSLLGLPEHWVSFGFLSDHASVARIWDAQFALILGGHLVAVVLGIRRAFPAPLRAHLPMTALMVGYTVLGLWLLSTATAG
jgi:hypothetical protein